MARARFSTDYIDTSTSTSTTSAAASEREAGPSSSHQPLLGSFHHNDIDSENERDGDGDTLLTASERFGDGATMAGLGASTGGMTRTGMVRAYWLGIVVCIGGFLCTSAIAIDLPSSP